ncbi:flagellar basal body L-ring protein FlgH [Algimonas porphyrae]|nr:flagellar basal body L-ring protein FlgH [Algimonas porphyrae]
MSRTLTTASLFHSRVSGRRSLAVTLLGSMLLTACAHSRAPQAVTTVQAAPIAYAAPTPAVHSQPVQTASLWSHSPESLFGDRRARGPGDILTVQINIDDRAEMRASVATDRSSAEGFSMPNLFGIGSLIEEILPNNSTLDPAVDLTRNSTVDGNGQLRRGETLSLTLAAQVAEITPNGDLVIIGRQNVQVEGEARTLFVSGIVRREDISRRNVITLDKIANAQVGYDGSGSVSRTTNDKIGTRVLDTVIPF